MVFLLFIYCLYIFVDYMAKENKKSVKMYSIELPHKLYNDLKAFSQANEISMSSVVRTGIKREIYVGKPLFKKLD